MGLGAAERNGLLIEVGEIFSARLGIDLDGWIKGEMRWVGIRIGFYYLILN